MKKFKAALGSLAISLAMASTPLSAATSVINVPVVDGAWTFVGVPGFQSYGASSTSAVPAWPSSVTTTNPVIIDGTGTTYQVSGLEVPTWDGNVSDKASTTIGTTTAGVADTDGATIRPVYLGAGVGSDIYATVGVMALGQSTSGAKSSSTDHDGATVAAISWTPMEKDYQSPIRTMYIRSANAAAPDIKVLYQARYEGEQFNVQFETGTATTLSSTDNTTYLGTFDKDYTYDNAAVLGTDFTVNSGTAATASGGSNVSGILASFDMDLSDNNMSTTKGDITPSTTTDSLRATLDGNMTVLGWDSTTQSWRQFRATGNGTSTTDVAANDFSTFTQGKGYWVRLDKDSAAATQIFGAPAGFVLGYDTAADINHSTFIADGWNMLSFGDEYLSYSVTGMIVTPGNVNEINITDTYGATTIRVPLTAAALTAIGGPSAQGTSEANCTLINSYLDRNNSFGYSNFNIRCIPTAGTTIALLSTRRFTIQTQGSATTLNGTTLTAESNGSSDQFYTSKYGEHALVIEPNISFFTDTGVDGNMSVEFPADSVGAIYANINGSVADNGTQTIATAMTTASATLGATNAVTVLDLNFGGTADAGDALLLASDYRFFVKDATLVRTFTYDDTLADSTKSNAGSTDNITEDNNVTVRIIGAALTLGTEGDITLVDDNLSATIINIEAAGVASNTEVNATRLFAGPNLAWDDVNGTLMIYYTGLYATDSSRIAKIDIQEWGNTWDLLTETDASSDTNGTAKGAIAKVWQVRSLVNFIEDSNSTGGYDGNYSGRFASVALTTDLKYNAVFADNFPIDGPLYDIVTGYGKKAELIITGQTAASTSATAGSFVSWKQIDVSKDPTEWYDNDDQFELFWTEKEKGYWVYLDGASTNDLSFDTPVLSGSPYAHFNNVFTGTSSTATTRNHLNHTLTVTANNLTAVGTATTNTDSFEVYASIGGSLTSFQRTSATNGFTIPISSHETNGMSFDAGTVAISITAAEGSGKKISTSYSLDYAKPVISAVTVSAATASVTITNGTTAASDIDVYSGDINDSNYGTSSASNWAGTATVSGDTTAVDLGAMGITFPTQFDVSTATYTTTTNYDSLAEQIEEGLIKDMRFTAKDAQTLYSNQYRLYYIPVYSGTGLLTSSDNTDSGWDANPYVYTASGIKNASYTGAAGGLDDGVQLKTAVNGTAITCVYAHNDVELNEAVANVKTIQTDSGTDVGVIAYMDEYIAQPFMCEVSGTIYIGAFVDADTEFADITMVPLSSSVTASIVKQ